MASEEAGMCNPLPIAACLEKQRVWIESQNSQIT